MINNSLNPTINPIIIKELRARMRGSRAFVTLTGALLLLGAVGYALYRMTLATSQYNSSPISPQIGQMLFTGLAFIELIIIAAVTPAITAGEISGEKEKQTYEMLLATPLSPTSILSGKLFAAMSYVFLLIFAAVPMASLVFIFGGVSLRDMLKAWIALVVIALLFGVIGLFFSCLLNRSGRATVLSYLTVSVLIFGPLFAAILAGVLRQGDPPRWIMSPSPLMVLASTFQPSINPQSISSTFYMLGSPIYWILGSPPISFTSIPRPVYHYGLPLYGLLSIILYFISTRLIRPVRRWKIHWSEAVLGLVVLSGFLGLVTLGYLATANRYENIQIISPATPIPPPPAQSPEVPAAEPATAPAGHPTPVPESPYPAPKGELPRIVALVAGSTVADMAP
jgi:ABC-2 type transport system permease protein